jgi:hypothetical protein
MSDEATDSRTRGVLSLRAVRTTPRNTRKRPSASSLGVTGRHWAAYLADRPMWERSTLSLDIFVPIGIPPRNAKICGSDNIPNSKYMSVVTPFFTLRLIFNLATPAFAFAGKPVEQRAMDSEDYQMVLQRDRDTIWYAQMSYFFFLLATHLSFISAHPSVINTQKSLPNSLRTYWLRMQPYSRAKLPRQHRLHPLSPKNATLACNLSSNPALFRIVDRVQKQLWKTHRALRTCKPS